MTQVRKLTAPLSAVFLIVVAGLALTLRSGTEYPPPILDPEFGLWVSDHDFGGKRPLVWQLEYERGVGDQILLQETEIANRSALAIQLFQDGTDQRWAFVRLGQTIDGTRLTALFNENVSVWLLLQDSCACSRPLSDQSSILEIQTNDGTHVLDFIFTETATEVTATPTHRTIYLQTTRGEWTLFLIDLTTQYKEARWSIPDRITLSIIMGAPGTATGWHTGYLHGFFVTKKTGVDLAQQRRPEKISHTMSSPSMLPATYQCTSPSGKEFLLRIGRETVTRV